METIKSLHKRIKENKIILDYSSLNGKANGLCAYADGEYFIIIDPIIIEDEPLHKVVIAEELGHYYTMIDDPTPRIGDSYHRRCRIDKEEEKALRWASKVVIPDHELLDYIADHIDAKLEDLIEYFVVTEEFMLKKLYYMSIKQPYYEVCDNHYLCLTELPSIYITRFFDTELVNKLKSLYGRNNQQIQI